MRRALRIAVLGGAALTMLACGTLLAASEDSPNPNPNPGASDASTESSDGPGTSEDSSGSDGGVTDGALTCPGVDVSTNDLNCGSCGTVCNSHHCTGGLCDPIVFVSSSTPNGAFPAGDVGADHLCQQLATTQGFQRPTKFYAWLSSTAQNTPFVRGLKLGPRKIWRSNGRDEVATGPMALTNGALTKSILLDETGNPGAQTVWTNVSPAGSSVGNNCGGWMSTAGMGATGDPGSITESWAAAAGFAGLACGQTHAIYCFESTEP